MELETVSCETFHKTDSSLLTEHFQLYMLCSAVYGGD